jgi:hypothetical protein
MAMNGPPAEVLCHSLLASGKEILLYFSLGCPTACCCCCEFAATPFYETRSTIITIKGITQSEQAFSLFVFSSNNILANKTSLLLGLRERSVGWFSPTVPYWTCGEAITFIVVDCCVVVYTLSCSCFGCPSCSCFGCPIYCWFCCLWICMLPIRFCAIVSHLP